MEVQTNKPKLSKLVAVNFMSLKEVEVNFKNFTSFNAKAKSLQALSNLAEAIKFVLDCSELPINKLHAGPSTTFVEAEISHPNGVTQLFRKTIRSSQMFYEIGGLDGLGSMVSADEYKTKVIETQVLLPVPNTLVINARNIDKVSSLTDVKRAEFIEMISGNGETVKEYELLSKQLELLKVDFDTSVKQKNTLTAEKNKLKKDMESAEEREQLIREFEGQEMQFDLFRMFHNNKFMETVDEEIESQKRNLEGMKKAVLGKIEEHKENDEQEANMRKELKLQEDNLEKMILDFQKPQMKVAKLRMSKSFTETKNREHKIQHDLNQKRIQKLSKEVQQMETLFNNRENFKALREKYLSLKKSFEQENSTDLFNYDVKLMLCHEDKLKYLRQTLDTLKSNEADKKAVGRSIQELHNKRQQMTKLMKSYTLKKAKLDVHTKAYNERENSIQQAKAKRDDFFKADRLKIVNELKQRFPEKVYGRLSELWEPVDVENLKLLKSRLGNFSEAIVVDTRSTAENCIEFLKIKQLSSINETFLPLSEFSRQKSSTALLPREKLPTELDCGVIESLISANTEEIAKAILHCIKPSIVAKSLADAGQLLKWKGSKKLNIVSLEAGATFETKGFIVNCGNVERISEEDIEDAEKNQFENKQKLMQMRFEVEKDASEFIALKEEIAQIDAEMQKCEVLLEVLNKTFNSSKLKTTQEEINVIEKTAEFAQQKAYLDQLKSQIKQKEAEHYKQFCDEARIENLDEFIENLKKMGSINEKALEERRKLISDLNKETDKAQDFDSEGLKAAENLLEVEEEKLNNYFKAVQETHQQHFELYNIKNQNAATSANMLKETLAVNEKIHEDLHKVQMGFKENFEILTRNFMEHQSLQMEEGTFEGFVVPPDDVPEDYRLVQDQLKHVELDFDRLKKNLKSSDGVGEKTLELTKKLTKLREKIETVSGSIKYEVNEQRFKRVDEGLKAANKLVTAGKAKLDSVDERLQAVRENRKQVFEKSLKVINEGIVEFCQLASSGNIASLKATNENEPYLGEISYSWPTDENPENKVTEYSQNYLSSLALMFGIFKLKEQKFVVLDDATRNISQDIDNFFKQQKNIQVVSLTSRLIEDNANYIVRPKTTSFIFKRIN